MEVLGVRPFYLSSDSSRVDTVLEFLRVKEFRDDSVAIENSALEGVDSLKGFSV